jgi:hypothetical protein
MQLIRHRPAAPLDRYIECFWCSHRDEPQDHGEHMLPSGNAQLVFALHEVPILWSRLLPAGKKSPRHPSAANPKSRHRHLQRRVP